MLQANRRHGTDGQTEGQTDRRTGATLNAARAEGGLHDNERTLPRRSYLVT